MSDLQVGREMDAAVAKALGCTVQYVGDNPICGCSAYPNVNHLTHTGGDDGCLGYFSTEVADAFAALEVVLAKRPDLEYQVSMTRTKLRGDQCACYFFYAHVLGCAASGNGSTPAEAICKAILALEATDGR